MTAETKKQRPARGGNTSGVEKTYKEMRNLPRRANILTIEIPERENQESRGEELPKK